MPFVKTTLQENTESIIRPSIMDIICQIKRITHIPEEVPIIYPGEIGKMQQQGSAINDPNRTTRLTSERYVHIEIEEDDDPQYMAATAVNYPEYNPIFHDAELGVKMFPLYATSQVTINFKYQSPSRTEIKRWRDSIRMFLSGGKDIHLHDISYHFLIPDAFLLLLKTIYDQKVRLEAQPYPFEKYVESHITSRAQLLTDLVGKDLNLSIAETQSRIVGRYEFDSLPQKPERENELAVWTCGFSYRFTYERPTMMAIRYPVMVGNKLLPEKYIAFWNQDYDEQNINPSFSYTIGSLNEFESATQTAKYLDFKSTYRLPDFDDFNPATTVFSTAAIYHALCEVNEIDRVTLFNLKESDPVIIDPDILEFIQKSEYPYLNQTYRSVFLISLYQNYDLIQDSFVKCLPDLTIQATQPLDLRYFYHVRFSLVCDLSLVDKQFFERAKKYPKAAEKIANAIREANRNHPEFKHRRDRNYSKDQFRDSFFDQQYLGSVNLSKTVMTGFVVVDKLPQLKKPEK